MARLCTAELYTIAVKDPFPYSAISEMQPVPPQEFYDAQERIASERVKAVAAAAQAAGVGCQAHTVEGLHPWEAILDHAKTQGCDLIVMASHGRRGVSALLLGSETQKVLTHSTRAGAGGALKPRPALQAGAGQRVNPPRSRPGQARQRFQPSSACALR
jgi:nucleotide-binding universal stress UspA family protein